MRLNCDLKSNGSSEENDRINISTLILWRLAVVNNDCGEWPINFQHSL